MNGKKKISILTAVLTIAILAGVLLYSVLAADPPEPYTVLVKYYDSVSTHYRLVELNGTLFDHPTDIPVGGIGRIGASPPVGGFTEVLAQQAYCIDPFVPFRSAQGTQSAEIGPVVPTTGYNGYLATFGLYGGITSTDKNYFAGGETWGEATTDWRGGYHAVPPWVMSDALKDNAAAVWWLVYNGYRGDFRAHEAESQASLTRINNAYGGAEGTDEYIDKTMAMMATKIAIWRVLTNDDASIFRLVAAGPNANFSDARQKVYSDLVDALVNDAKKANMGTPPIGTDGYTKMTLTLDATHMLSTDAADEDPQFAYYGPILLNAAVENGVDVNGKEINVFLSATGPFSDGVGFATLSGAAYSELPTKPLPNSGGQQLHCVSRTFSGSICAIDDLYLKVPISRMEALGQDLVPNELLLVRAMASALDIGVVEGTPVPIAALSGDDVQDWDVAQAFVGAAASGASINMFAEIAVRTQEDFDGEITITKNLTEANTADAGRRFQFTLLYGPSPYLSAATQVDLDLHDISPAANRIGETNNFWLTSNSAAIKITNLPEHFFYWLVELREGMGDFNAPMYDVRAGIPEAGVAFPARAVAIDSPVNGYRTCHIRLDEANARAEIIVSNTKDRERAVQTGDDRSIILPIVVVSFGVLCLAAAEVYRRRLNKKTD